MIIARLALFFFLASAANAGDLGPYSGEYRGIMRSDSSPIGYGEVEMRINKRTLTVRIATGKGVDVQERKWDEYLPLSKGEVAALFRAGSAYPARVSAFRSGKNRWPMKILFLSDPSFENREFAVTLRHDIFDTMLLGPAQLARGDFEKMLKIVENQYGKGRLPRLPAAGAASGKNTSPKRAKNKARWSRRGR